MSSAASEPKAIAIRLASFISCSFLGVALRRADPFRAPYGGQGEVSGDPNLGDKVGEWPT
jgi:hypothetical protein